MAREHSIHFLKTFQNIQKQKEAIYEKVEKRTAGASQIHYAENGFPVKETRIIQLDEQLNEMENEVRIITMISTFSSFSYCYSFNMSQRQKVINM